MSALVFELFLPYERWPLYLPYKTPIASWGNLGCINLSDHSQTIQLLEFCIFFLSCVLTFSQTNRLMFLICIHFLLMFLCSYWNLVCHAWKGDNITKNQCWPRSDWKWTVAEKGELVVFPHSGGWSHTLEIRVAVSGFSRLWKQVIVWEMSYVGKYKENWRW